MSNNPYNGHEDFSDGIGRGYTLVRNGVISSLPVNPEPEIPVEEPWPPAVILPVKYLVNSETMKTTPSVIVNFIGGRARVDFGDGSVVNEYDNFAEYDYGELATGTFEVTVTPLSKIALLETDIQELVDWGSAGSVKRFKFQHPAPFIHMTLPNWIKDTSYMFEMCQGFSQDLSSWEISNVVNMEGMFRECRSQSSYLVNWDVSNVTNMSHTFEGTGGFSGFSSWNTAKVTDMSYMFSDASGGESVSGIENWDTSSVVNMSNMFSHLYQFNCDLSTWDVSNVTDMSYMFSECHSLFSRGDGSGFWSLENWNVSKVTNMEHMFYMVFAGVPSNISRWDTGNVTNMKGVFAGCQSMNHLTFWDTSKVVTMEGMFEQAFQFNSDISNWNVGNVINMDRMFKGVQWLVISLNKWCVEKITEEPIEFMPDAKDKIPENSPKWGTCPIKTIKETI